jgi:ADP-heptose:LPS heptosyltransferase
MRRDLLILLDKTVFQVLFLCVVLYARLFKRRPTDCRPKVTGKERFLVIRPGGLGDGLMSVPLLKALRRTFPESSITVMCVRKNRGALENLPFPDDLIVMDDLPSIHRNVYRICRGGFDVVLDLEPFRKISSVIGFLSGAGIRVGFDTNRRRELFTHYVTYANEKCYEARNLTRQLDVLGVDLSRAEGSDMSFPLSEGLVRETGGMLGSHGIDPDRDFIVTIVPGVLKPHHRWIMERFSSLVERVLGECDQVKILLLGSPGDVTDAQEVMRCLARRERVLNLVGETSFMESLAVLRASRILVSCDGGIVYMAAAMGCSTISLWGPGVMERFKPPGEEHVGVRKDYFCVPCVNYSRLGEFPGCAYNRRCMNDITVDDVFGEYVALKSRMEGRSNRGPDRQDGVL